MNTDGSFILTERKTRKKFPFYCLQFEDSDVQEVNDQASEMIDYSKGTIDSSIVFIENRWIFVRIKEIKYRGRLNPSRTLT